MKFYRLLHPVMVLGVLGLASVIAAQDESESDRNPIVAMVQSYVDAFNKRDAKSVSELWASNGEFVDDKGKTIYGQRNIRKAIEKQFAEMDESQLLAVTINKITFISDDVAIEDGTAEISGEISRYTAIHKKENGVWRLHSIRESVVENQESQSSRLQDLEWLIGEWVDQSDEAIVRTSCRWSKNKNFIMNNFKAEMPGLEPLEGTQVIGFDAARGRIRSWTFNSNGGIAEAVWTKKGNQWTVRSRSVTFDGGRGSSTNIFTIKDRNEFSWKSVKRTINGEKLPDIEAVNVIRLKDDSGQ